MAILLREGFGNLTDGTHTAGTTRQILGEQWQAYSENFAIEDRADGRKWIKSDGTARNVKCVSKTWSGASTIAFGVRVTRGGTVVSTIVNFYDGSSRLGSLHFNSSGYLYYNRPGYDWNPIDGIVATCNVALAVGDSAFFEARITFHNTTGAVSFYKDGVLVNTVSGIDTIAAGTSCTKVELFDGRSSAQCLPSGWKFSDFLVHTDTSPIGDVGVYYKPVDGDIGTPDFTALNAGDNEAELDEIGPDEDTTHNESDGTAGHRDQFSAAGLAGMTILEVCTLVRARKTSTGTATLLLGMEENATEGQSAAKALSESYLTLIAGWATNPDTSAAWATQEAIDALISYEVGA